MQNAPKSVRLQIGIFGRTNVGKSSFLNMIAGQDVSIISPVPGTTTDVVEKTMELLPVGPVIFLDTGGIDDVSLLSEFRIRKTKKIFERSDIAVLIIEPNVWSSYEEEIIREIDKRNIPLIIVVNKIDIKNIEPAFIEKINKKNKSFMLCSSVNLQERDKYVNTFKQKVIEICPQDFLQPQPLIRDLVPEGATVLLIVPIDMEAPKGRIILPQVQVIRDLLDNNSAALIVKEDEYVKALNNLKKKPDLVVCDSQVVLRMVRETPPDIKCTTFSMLFSRNRGMLSESLEAINTLKNLKTGDKVLISEACSHHPIEGDIGRQKIPKWIRQYLGIEPCIESCAGRDYPMDLRKYKLIIHCGACMITRREMLFRIQKAKEENVPIINYGVCISYIGGVLERVLAPIASNQVKS